MKGRGILPGQKILEIGYIKPPEDVCSHLELPAGHDEKVLCIERLRLGDGVPMGLQISYYVLPEGQTITRKELEEYGSTYRILQEKFHLIPTEADETLEVALATPREGFPASDRACQPIAPQRTYHLLPIPARDRVRQNPIPRRPLPLLRQADPLIP